MGADSGLFCVPEVRACDLVEGTLDFEWVEGLRPLLDLYRSGDPRLPELLGRVGQTLAVVHQYVGSPGGTPLPLPAPWMELPETHAFLHGDFTAANVCVREPDAEIVVVDWAAAPMFERPANFGSIYFDLEDAHQLQYYDNRLDEHVHGWQTILVTDFEHPYMDKWWVPGCTIGYEHTFINALADFLEGLEKGEPVRPNFRDALATQHVCDAVLKSADTETWQTVSE